MAEKAALTKEQFDRVTAGVGEQVPVYVNGTRRAHEVTLVRNDAGDLHINIHVEGELAEPVTSEAPAADEPTLPLEDEVAAAENTSTEYAEPPAPEPEPLPDTGNEGDPL